MERNINGKIMAVNFATTFFIHTASSVPSLPPLAWPSSFSSSPFPALSRIRTSCFSSSSSSSSSSPLMDPLSKFKELPYVSPPQRDLMLDLVSALETRLGSSLLPCSLPPDVQYHKSQNGSSEGSLYIRSGIPSSPVDFILGNWLHCKLPTGGNINIITLATYMKSLNDTPNLVFEVIQNSPTSYVVLNDLLPRKDLVLYPEYLKTFYEDTELDRHRQEFEKLAEVSPYTSSSLFIRTSFSPTAIIHRVKTESGETTRADEIVRDHVSPIAKETLKTWLDLCDCVKEVTDSSELSVLKKRDQILKRKSIETDLGTSYPRLFGEEVAERVLTVIREFSNA